MPMTNPSSSRKRPINIRVTLTPAEKKELERAAAKTDIPLSTLVRTLALGAVRRGKSVAVTAQAA